MNNTMLEQINECAMRAARETISAATSGAKNCGAYRVVCAKQTIPASSTAIMVFGAEISRLVMLDIVITSATDSTTLSITKLGTSSDASTAFYPAGTSTTNVVRFPTFRELFWDTKSSNPLYTVDQAGSLILDLSKSPLAIEFSNSSVSPNVVTASIRGIEF